MDNVRPSDVVPQSILPQSVCYSFIPPKISRDLFFYLTWCGHYYCNSQYYIQREYYAPLLLVFVRAGALHVRYRGKTFDARRGDILLLDCSEPHFYQAYDGLEFLYIHFDGSNAHEICSYILDTSGPLIRKDDNALIGEHIDEMVDFYGYSTETMYATSLRIYHLLMMLLEPPQRERLEDDPINLAVQYIRNNVGKAITLEELASSVNLSVYYFSHRFRQQTGFSPMEYVINTRLNKAQVLLTRTSLSVAEIAHKVGYSNSASLINLFVKKFNCSPKQFRQNRYISSAGKPGYGLELKD